MKQLFKITRINEFKKFDSLYLFNINIKTKHRWYYYLGSLIGVGLLFLLNDKLSWIGLLIFFSGIFIPIQIYQIKQSNIQIQKGHNLKIGDIVEVEININKLEEKQDE